MSTIQAELYEALIEADASKEKAHAAAAAVAAIPTNYPKPEELVTKADLRAEIAALEARIAELEARIAELEARIAELKGEIVALEGRMDSKMAELKDELKAEIAGLKDEMADLKVAMAHLEGRMDSKIAELEVHLMQQNKESTRMIIGAIVAATSVMIAATAVLAFVS